MSHQYRPTMPGVNTVARHRFDDSTPTTYVAAHQDGTYGPERSTREEAEADYTNGHRAMPPYGLSAATYMQLARQMKAQMQASGDKDHAALVYEPGIRQLVDMARGANYAEMIRRRTETARRLRLDGKACAWLPDRTQDLPEHIAYTACRNFYNW